MPFKFTPEDIARVLDNKEPEERLGLMRTMLKGAPSSLFWPVFLEWFPRCDDIWPHHRWLRPMLVHARNAHSYMAAPDKQAFNDLDPEQWVLRGAQSTHKSGLSWTTDPATADYFARLHSTRGAQGFVYEAMIAKRDIFAVYQGDHGLTVLLNNTKLYEINRVDEEKKLGDTRPSFEPNGRYYDDNDDRKTAELQLNGDSRAWASMGASPLGERTARLPPIENMTQINLVAALKEVSDELQSGAKTKKTVEQLLKRRMRLEGELEARARGAKPGRLYVKNGGGSWGQKGKSPGRPSTASRIITLPVLTRLLLSANVRDEEDDDKAA